MVAGLTSLGAGVVALLLGGTVIEGWFVYLGWRRRDIPGATQFGAFAFFAGAWNLATALQYVSPWLDVSFALYQAGNALALLAGFLWPVFALYYVGYDEEIPSRVWALVWADPAAYILLMATNSWHGLLPTTRNPTTFAGLQLFDPPTNWLVDVQTAISFAAALVGFALIGRFALRNRGGYRRQALTLLGGSIAVMLTSALYRVVGLTLHDGMDPAPLAMVGMTIVVAFALFRYDFLSVAQLAPERLFDELPDPVIVLDDHDRVVETNEAGSSFVATGRPLSRTVPTLAGALGTTDRTVTLTTSKDERRTYDVTVEALTDPYDTTRGRLVVLRDVTARKRRERELERQNERLDRFAAIVSHDLRNPLNVADGYTQLAIERDSVEPLTETQAALADMETLIEDVLTLARDGEPPDLTWIEFESLAADAWPFVGTDGPTLVVESGGYLRADPERSSVLLGNLFRNAHDHGGDDVTVRTGLTDDGFYVVDDGPGISAAEFDRVFEEGYSTSETGTGLGLSIVTTIADAHGWDVSVAESGADGARFDVSGASIRRATS